MSESLLGNTVYLTNAEYSTLIVNGSVTLASGTTVTYSENDTYIVPETLDTTPINGSTNAVTSGGVYSSIETLNQAKLDKSSVKGKGSATQPVYFDSNGTAQACTYTLGKSVPCDAVFTDHIYTAGNLLTLSENSTFALDPQHFSQDGSGSVDNLTLSVAKTGTTATISLDAKEQEAESTITLKANHITINQTDISQVTTKDITVTYADGTTTT